MLKSFIKRSSKFVAVLLTATLAFTPLSYATGHEVISDNQTRSNETYSGYTDSNGGVFYVENTGNLTLSGVNSLNSNTVTWDGGAIYNEGIVTIGKNCEFSSNKSGSYGGAIYNKGIVTIEENIEFSSNTTQSYGGAIHNQNGTVQIGDRAKFNSNKAQSYGGAILNNPGSTLTIGSDVEFILNEASNVGGAIYNEDATVQIGDRAKFSSNIGGAIYNTAGGTVTIGKDVEFSSNKAGTYGGAIHNSNNSTIIFEGNATFIDNKADGKNNDIYNTGNIYFSTGIVTMTGGITGNTGTVEITNAAVLLDEGASFIQENLNIGDKGSLSINANNMTVEQITNNGELIFTGGTNYALSKLTGTGDTYITVDTANVTIDTTDKTIKQDTIYTSGGKTLLLTGTGGITADIENYMTGDCLDIATTITGNVTNNPNSVINIKKVGETAGAISGQITNSGLLSNEAKFNVLTNFDVQTGITGDESTVSYNKLNVKGISGEGNESKLTSTKTIENQTITVQEYGSINLSGAGKIKNSNLTIEENGSVFANAEKLEIINKEIINDGTLTLVGENVINENKIVNSLDDTSKGKVIFGDGTSNSIINNAYIKQNEIDVSTGTKVTNNNILISEKLDIKGEFVNNNTDTRAIIVSGADGITISSTTAVFTTNASAIETAKIANMGTLNFTGGTNINAITGDGTTIISGDVISSTSIANSITINETKSLTISANDVDGKVTNAGTLNLEAGILEKEVSGTGNIITKGNISTDADNLKNIVTNDYELTLTSGTVTKAISGAGTTIINYDITSNASIANAITINADKSLTITADNVDGAVTNAGTLKLGTGILEQIVSGTGNIVTTGNITTDANNLGNAVTNNEGNTLTLTSGTIAKEIKGTGTTIISGDVINSSTTVQNAVTINSTGSLATDADNIITTVGITNDGYLTFNADGTNNNIINGAGTLVTTANVTNNANISQQTVEVQAGTFTSTATITAQNINIASGAILESKAANLTATGVIENEGTLKWNSGATDDTNANKITEEGKLLIDNNTTVSNTGEIAQDSMEITSGSAISTNADKLLITKTIQNAGTITFNGGTNKNYIVGVGTTTISGNVINDVNAAIEQIAVNIGTGSSLELNNINNIKVADKITNDGTLTIATTDGTNKNDIVRTDDGGNLNINSNIVNEANISQKVINIKDGVKLETAASNIDSKDTDTIVLNGANSLLTLTDNNLSEPSELKSMIEGTGSIKKQGEGTVILSGDNTYSGTTTISGGALQISSADNIGANTIYMDSGKLITYINKTELPTTIIALNNEITATGNNDIKIETKVDDDDLMSTLRETRLTNKIYGNENLVKTGKGTLTLSMDSNAYAGDTIVEDGMLIGTTSNINGIVKGNNHGSVLFYDSGEVTLNEIDNVASFTKQANFAGEGGNAKMYVDKNFTADNAYIMSGEFIINNDTAQSIDGIICSGNKFEVANNMQISGEDTYLRGYSNVKAGTLTIKSGATLAPGNSIGQINLDGNLEMGLGSNYDVEFTQFAEDSANAQSMPGELANDKVVATQSATIDANAKLQLTNIAGKYYIPEEYTLIASNGLTGNYDLANVTFIDNDSADLRAGFDSRISYELKNDGNNLILIAQRKASEYSKVTEFTRSHNQNEVAKAIDNISAGVSGDIVNVLDQLENYYYYNSTYDTVALQEALNDMSGAIYANTGWLTVINSKAEHVFDKIGDRARTPDLYPCSKIHDRVWGEYYYNNFHTDANADSRKFDTETNGFLVGFDVLTLGSWTMGVTAGYGESDLKQAKSDTSKMKDINLGFYGGYEGQNWVLKGMLLGGYEMYDTTRNIGFMNRQATSGHDGYSGTLDLEAGYKIALNPNSKKEHKLFLKPFAGLSGNYTEQNGFNEKGANSLNLSVDQHKAFTAQAKAGIGINGKTKAFEWYADGYAKKFLTDGYMEATTSLIDFSGTTEMRIKSADMSSMTIGARVGGDYNIDENWKIFANILASRSDTTRNYYGNIGVSYKFDCLTNKDKKNDEINNNSEKDKEIAKLKKEIKKLQKDVENANEKLNIVSEQEAKTMKAKVVKQFKLESKPTFVFNSSELTQKGIGSLAQVVLEINTYKNCDVLVEGHTDSFGDDDYNQKLSEQRAISIANALKYNYGVKNKISIIGKGEKDPLVSNDTEKGREQNRRVEITIVTTQN